jgi:hypothetical protein
MATYYWVGGSGTWDAFDTTHWSATSGGAGGAGVPSSDDSVIFNSASSGVAYVVQVSGAQCGQITTSAPATGTLTFSNTVANNGYFFTTYASSLASVTVNIHAACLFTPGASYSYGVISVNNYGPGATTVTFNSSGTNTQKVYLDINCYNDLTCCSAQTGTFAGISTYQYGGITFTCINSTLTINSGAGTPTSSGIAEFGEGASTVTMTGTSLVVGSLTTPFTDNMNIAIGNYATTWNISTLNITIRTAATTYTPYFSVGRYGTTRPSAMGAVVFEGVINTYPEINAYFDKCSTLTVKDFRVNILPPDTSATTFTATGAVAVTTTAGNTAFSYLDWNYGWGTVTLSSTVAITGAASQGYATLNTGGATSIASTLIATDATVYISGTTTVTGATTLTRSTLSINGGYGALVSSDITGTGGTTSTTVNYIALSDLTCPSLTLTNIDLEVFNYLTVNGGVGKTFSFTVNSSAVASVVYGYNYPGIRAFALTVTTPTMSITGTATKRVVCKQSTGAAIWTITPTPTLQYVTFLSIQVNYGASNFSGTSIGTDGLSVGIVAQAPRTLYCVAVGTQAFDAAIWATTPGGAGSTTNYPLPQDTIVFTTAVMAAGAVSLTSDLTSLYIGGITVEASTNQLDIAKDATTSGFGGYVRVYIYGNLYTSTTSQTYIGYYSVYSGAEVVMSPSSLTTRYVSGKWYLSSVNLYFTGLANSGMTYNVNSGSLSTNALWFGGNGNSGEFNFNSEGTNTISAPYVYGYGGNINFSNTTIYSSFVRFYGYSEQISVANTPYTIQLAAAPTAVYSNEGGFYRGGTLLLTAPAAAVASYTLTSVNVSTLRLEATTASSRSLTALVGVVVRNFSMATANWNFSASSTSVKFNKANGGRVQFNGNLTTSRLGATPTDTWYVSGTLTQQNGATGWVQGTIPGNNGGFFAL